MLRLHEDIAQRETGNYALKDETAVGNSIIRRMETGPASPKIAHAQLNRDYRSVYPTVSEFELTQNAFARLRAVLEVKVMAAIKRASVHLNRE